MQMDLQIPQLNINPAIILGLLLALALAGCSSGPSISEQTQKESWLKKNLDAKKKARQKSSLVKLPPGLRFRDHILKGKLAHGMNFTDALATLRMAPWGKREQKAVFWCDGIRAHRCNDRCVKCEAMLFGRNHIAMLDGIVQQMTVNNFYPSKFSNFRATVTNQAADFADLIYKREIRHGMSAGLVQMIINLEGHKTQYRCSSGEQQNSASCLGRCRSCMVEISPRSSGQQPQTIFLGTTDGRQSVTGVVNR